MIPIKTILFLVAAQHSVKLLSIKYVLKKFNSCFDLIPFLICNSRPLKSDMRLSEIGPITIGSNFRDFISYVLYLIL